MHLLLTYSVTILANYGVQVSKKINIFFFKISYLLSCIYASYIEIYLYIVCVSVCERETEREIKNEIERLNFSYLNYRVKERHTQRDTERHSETERERESKRQETETSISYFDILNRVWNELNLNLFILMILTVPTTYPIL